MKHSAKSCLLTCLLAMLFGCADDRDSDQTGSAESLNSSETLNAGADKTPPSCVESPPPGGIQQCFNTPGEYARFKACFLRTNNMSKCYAKRNECPARHILQDDMCIRACAENARLGEDGECHPLPVACPEGEGWTRDTTGLCLEDPHPVPPQPQYPAGAYFQFDYIIRTLTDDQRNRIRHGVLDMKTLINRPVCRFVGANQSATNAIRVRQRTTNSAGAPVYSMTFIITGDSPGCDQGRANRFQVELRDIVPGHNGPAYIDWDPLAFVRTTLKDYLFAFGWGNEETDNLPPPVIYFNYQLPGSYGGAGSPLEATFEFLAQEDGDKNTYMLGFYGSVRVP